MSAKIYQFPVKKPRHSVVTLTADCATDFTPVEVTGSTRYRVLIKQVGNNLGYFPQHDGKNIHAAPFHTRTAAQSFIYCHSGEYVPIDWVHA